MLPKHCVSGERMMTPHSDHRLDVLVRSSASPFDFIRISYFLEVKNGELYLVKPEDVTYFLN